MLKNAVCPQNVRKSDIFAPNFIFYARKFSEKIVFFSPGYSLKKCPLLFMFLRFATRPLNCAIVSISMKSPSNTWNWWVRKS